jgi:hypothetical protein
LDVLYRSPGLFLADVRRYGVMVPQILQDGLMADVFGTGYLE